MAALLGTACAPTQDLTVEIPAGAVTVVYVTFAYRGTAKDAAVLSLPAPPPSLGWADLVDGRPVTPTRSFEERFASLRLPLVPCEKLQPQSRQISLERPHALVFIAPLGPPARSPARGASGRTKARSSASTGTATCSMSATERRSSASSRPARRRSACR